jgi:hypothetical protein
VETPSPSYSPRDHMILRVHLVSSLCYTVLWGEAEGARVCEGAGPNPLSTTGADAPDPSGSMDARLESDYGIVLVSALPQRAGDPWIGVEDVAMAGAPQVRGCSPPPSTRG